MANLILKVKREEMCFKWVSLNKTCQWRNVFQIVLCNRVNQNNCCCLVEKLELDLVLSIRDFYADKAKFMFDFQF